MYSLESFLTFSEITEAVVVMPESYIDEYGIFSSDAAKITTVAGGKERWESVRNGFKRLSGQIDNVIIHDAARPFVPTGTIENCLHQISKGNNVVTGIPVVDTIKQVSGHEVTATVDRSKLIAVFQEGSSH